MRSWLSIVFVGVSGLALVSCGSGGSGDPFNGTGGTGGTGGVKLDCTTLTNPPPGCDDICPSGSDSECELSTFCLNGVCSAQCTTDDECGAGSSCNSRGRCVPDIGTGGTGGTGNTGGNNCQSVQVNPTRSIPNVMFLVDQSGSMVANFGGGEDRWEAAHSGINTIVSGLDSIVRFGLTTYTSRDGDLNPPCPRLPTQVDFDLDNSGTIGNDSIYPYTYPDDAGEDTPTGDSIDALVSSIQATPPPNEGPTIIVLATDGEPDSCEYPDPSNSTERDSARGEAVSAAANSNALGMDLFVLWVGELTSTSTRNHLQEVADAGVDGTGTVWVGDNPSNLQNAFQQIISDSISCDIQMDERFVDKDKACAEGVVRLDDGAPLACSDTNGWRVKPGADDVIELVGSACDTFKSGDVTLSALFPCGTVIVVE